MITILSHAKTLDFESELPTTASSQPSFVDESDKLIRKLRSLSKKKVAALMHLNPDLAALNVDRYQDWEPHFDQANSRQAMFAFNGEVYRGLDAYSLTEQQIAFAQDHLRVLSGLHGLLRPLDLVRPYRLEMGTKLPVQRKKNLYEFWGDKVTEAINEALDASGSDTLLNLASSEYFKVIDFKKVNGKVITPVFKDLKNGEYKVVMTWAKHARGAMANFMIKNGINEVEEMKLFDEYQFSAPMSSENEWVFIRG